MQSFIDLGKVRSALNLNPNFTSFSKIILECETESKEIQSVKMSFIDSEIPLSDSITGNGRDVTPEWISQHFIDIINAAFTAGANRVCVSAFVCADKKLAFSEEYSF